MLFPQIQQNQAAEKIGEMLKQADIKREALPNPSGIIDTLKQKHLGSPSSPNYDELMPNTIPAEKTKIEQLIRRYIATMGSGPLEPQGFQDLQKIKNAFDRKAKWDKTTTSAEMDLNRNFSRKIGDMIKEGIPEIKKPYADYGRAANEVQNKTGGINGLIYKLFNSGGAGGWMMRQAFLYPAIGAAGHKIKDSFNMTQPQQPNSVIGYRGSVH